MSKTDKTNEIVIKKEWGEVAEKFITALQQENNQGNYTVTAKVAGVNRSYVYELFAKFPDFFQACEAIRAGMKKFNAQVAENKLMKLVDQGNVTAVIFALKKYNPEEFGDKGVDKPSDPITHELSEGFRYYLAHGKLQPKKSKSSGR